MRGDLAKYATEFNPELCAMCRITMRAAYAIADRVDNGDTRQISELRRLQAALRACQPSHPEGSVPDPVDALYGRRNRPGKPQETAAERALAYREQLQALGVPITPERWHEPSYGPYPADLEEV